MLKYDLIIVGAGYIGLSLAGMLAETGIKIAIITNYELDFANPPKDVGRLFAISLASCDILKLYGLDHNIDNIAQSINYIRVVDYNSSATTDFDPNDLGLDKFGYMVDEYVLLANLYHKLAQYKNICLFSTSYYNIESREHFAELHLDNSDILQAELIVAADGKKSQARQNAFIPIYTKKYQQIAVVFDIAHELCHQGIAVEKFMPNGPFAILPKLNGFTSSIVWVEKTAAENVLKTMPREQIHELIAQRFDNYLGEIQIISEIKIFPLELTYAKQYFNGRIVIIGDALHSIHPLAGQGFNLGLRDADLLAQLIMKNLNLGIDIGIKSMLVQYQNYRKKDVNLLISATDTLNSIFSNNFIPLRCLRRLGLQTIDKIPPLKKIFMYYAMGYTDLNF